MNRDRSNSTPTSSDNENRENEPLLLRRKRVEDIIRSSKGGKFAVIFIIFFNHVGLLGMLPEYVQMIDTFMYTKNETQSVTVWKIFIDSQINSITFTILPIFGGILADVYLGKYKTCLFGSVSQIIGSALITVVILIQPHNPGLRITMIVIGSLGFIVSSVGCCCIITSAVALLGLQGKENESLRAYLWCIWAFNAATMIMEWPIPRILFAAGITRSNDIYHIIFCITSLTCNLIVINILFTSKRKGILYRFKADGQENYEKFLYKCIPIIWSKLTQVNREYRRNVYTLRRFFYYLAVIISSFIAYYLIYTQCFTSILLEINIGLEGSSCSNKTGNELITCQEKYTLDTKLFLIPRVLPIVILVPIIEIFTEKNNSRSRPIYRKLLQFFPEMREPISYPVYNEKYTWRNVCIGLSLAIFVLLNVLIYGLCDSHLNSKSFSDKHISAFWMLPIVIFIALAQITILTKVYQFAFLEAERNLPGMTGIYFSFVIMVEGMANIIGWFIYFVIHEIIKNEFNETNAKFIEAKNRMYSYIVLLVITVIIAIVLRIASKKFSQFLIGDSELEESPSNRTTRRGGNNIQTSI